MRTGGELAALFSICFFLCEQAIPCLASDTDPPRSHPFKIQDTPGTVSTWEDHRGAEFSGYASISKSAEIKFWTEIMPKTHPLSLDSNSLKELNMLWRIRFKMEDKLKNDGCFDDHTLPTNYPDASALMQCGSTACKSLVYSEAQALADAYAKYRLASEKPEESNSAQFELCRLQLVTLVGENTVTELDRNWNLRSPASVKPDVTALARIKGKPAWELITQYCEEPQALGTYDIEAIGLLWIAFLHQQTETSGNTKFEYQLTPDEVPLYVYILGVLNLPEYNAMQATERRTNIPSNYSLIKWQFLFDSAKSLVTAYSHYMTPIKRKGAFAKRDTTLRNGLSNLVGVQAVDSLDDDYVNGGKRLQKLADSYINEFRLRRLTTMKNGLPDNQILEAFNSTTWQLPSNDLKPADIAELKKLWQTYVSSNRITELAQQQLKENIPHLEHLDRLEYLAAVAQDAVIWSKSLPTYRGQGTAQNTGNFPFGGSYSLSDRLEYKLINTSNYQLQFLIERAEDLIRTYRTLKSAVTPDPNLQPKYGNVSQDLNSSSGNKAIFWERARARMVSLVGEENVRRLQMEWAKEK